MDDDEYWLAHCYLFRRRETSDRLENYPDNCSYFIKEIRYGVNLLIIFPGTVFPENETGVR